MISYTAFLLLEGHGVRREVVGVLSALEVNDSQELVVFFGKSEVFQAEGPRNTSVQHGMYHLDLHLARAPSG